jgi:ferredoxin
VTLPYEETGAPACIACGACSWVCPVKCIEIEPMAIERLRQRWGQERPCRYALLGLVPSSVCPHDYRCSTCQVDHEMFELAGGRHPAFLREPGHGGES